MLFLNVESSFEARLFCRLNLSVIVALVQISIVHHVVANLRFGSIQGSGLKICFLDRVKQDLLRDFSCKDLA